MFYFEEGIYNFQFEQKSMEYNIALIYPLKEYEKALFRGRYIVKSFMRRRTIGQQ